MVMKKSDNVNENVSTASKVVWWSLVVVGGIDTTIQSVE